MTFVAFGIKEVSQMYLKEYARAIDFKKYLQKKIDVRIKICS